MYAALLYTCWTMFFLVAPTTGVGGKLLLDSFNIPRTKPNIQLASLVSYSLFLMAPTTGKLLDSFNIPRAKSNNIQLASLATLPAACWTIFFLMASTTGVGGNLLDSFNIPRTKPNNVQLASLVRYSLQQTKTRIFSICVYFRPAYQVNQEDMVLFDTGSGSDLIRAGLFKDGMGGWVEVGNNFHLITFIPRQISSLDNPHH